MPINCSNAYSEQKEHNRLLVEAEMQAGKNVLESLPLAVFVELTQNCNLHCPYCREHIAYSPQLDMPLDLFKIVADALFPTATLVDLRGWGESTILRHFNEVVDITASYGVQIRLVTNGTNRSVSVWDKLMSYHAIVGVSCDSSDPDLFASIRAGGDLEKVKQSIRTLVERRDYYGAPSENVYITTVVSLANARGLPALVEMARNFGIGKVVLFPIGIQPDHPWHLRHDLPVTRASLQAARETADRLGIELQLASALDDTMRLADDTRKRCIHPWSYAVIDYCGRVGFCDLLVGSERHFFGTLQQSDFRTIWNGAELQSLRNQHTQARIDNRFSPCRWCYLMRYLDFEQIIFPELQPGVVTNRTRTSLAGDHEKIDPVPEFY